MSFVDVELPLIYSPHVGRFGSQASLRLGRAVCAALDSLDASSQAAAAAMRHGTFSAPMRIYADGRVELRIGGGAMTLRAFEDWIETAGPPPESPETALLRSMWPLLQPRLANADNPIPHKDAYLRALQDALERWQNAQPPEAARVYWPALQRSFETAWVAWRKSWSVCG